MAKLTDLRQSCSNMDQKSKPRTAETKSQRDLATFERQPEDKKELMKLKDQEERTTGPEHVVISRQIAEKTRKPKP